MHTKFLAGLVLTGGLLHAAQPQPLNDGFLTRLRAEAVHNHPAVATAKLRADAAALDVLALRLWDDPMVGLGVMAAPRQMRADLGDLVVGLEQALPKPGMFEAKRRKAEALQRAEIATMRAASLGAGALAATNAIELALADESISLQQAQVGWLAAMAENARQRAADPMGSSSDALRMETELAKETQMLEAARRNRETLSNKLNITLGRPLEATWPLLQLPAMPPPVPIAKAEIARLARLNPKMRALKEMAAAAGQETRIAERERLPGLALGIDSNVYSGGNYRSTTVGLKMNLPWFNERSYQANMSAAHSRELATSRDLESLHRELASDVLTNTTEAANAAAQARAYAGEIHDNAQHATKSIEAAWLSSKAPLTDLLDASRTLFAIRLEQRRFIAMQLAALEQLYSLVPNP
ncbi:MAG: TolC family protein [Verrucomicrobiota bacterium]